MLIPVDLSTVGVEGEPISYSGLSYDFLLRQCPLPKQTPFEKLLTPPLTRETAGRTYKELDELFTNKVAGRKFKSIKTQTELEGMQAKDIQSEKTKGGQTVEQ